MAQAVHGVHLSWQKRPGRRLEIAFLGRHNVQMEVRALKEKKPAAVNSSAGEC